MLNFLTDLVRLRPLYLVLAGAMRAITQRATGAADEDVIQVSGACARLGRPTLHYQQWTSQTAEWDRTAVLVVMHGYGEHAGCYAELATFMVGRHHPVCGFDARGHGESPGQRGYIRDYGQYVDDLCSFLVRVHARYRGRPVLLLGHSAGALIATRALQQSPDVADALILCSPLFALQERHKPVGPLLAQLIARLLPRLPLSNGIADNELTHDFALLAEISRDRLRHARTTPAWYAATLRTMRQVEQCAGQLVAPVLIIAAGQDTVVDPRAALRMTERFASDDKQLVIRDRASHEVLNEVDRGEVYALIASWIRARFVT
jgi:alpha-beta hydrolase superfamily lysophospholipase